MSQDDPSPGPPLIDHLGLDLWRAAQDWQGRFAEEMAARGFPVFETSRAALIPHLSRSGTPQSELHAALRMTKQAVNQHVDALIADGLVERRPDPEDGRRKLICFTRAGLDALREANVVKQELHDEALKKLGEKELQRLRRSLRRLAGEDA